MPNRIYLAGQTFGKRKVIEDLPRKNHQSYVLCECECGRQDIVQTMALKFGNAQQCKNCSGRQGASKRVPKHGNARHGFTSKTYMTWMAMNNRCHCTSNPEFHNYGGRGISVCQRWKDFSNFLQDMGHRPLNKELDRINSNGNYEPGNCRWATRKEQCRNTRRNRFVTAFGKTATIAEFAEIYDQPYARLLQRLNHGWNVEKAITAPVNYRSVLKCS